MANAEKKTKSSRSLAVTITVVVFGISVLSLAVSGTSQAYLDFRAQRRCVTEKQQLIAVGAADKVSRYIQEKFAILEEASIFGDLENTSLKEREIILGKLLGQEPSFRQVVLLDVQTQEEVLRVSRLSRVMSMQSMRYDKAELFSSEEFMSREERYVSSVYFDRTTNEPIVTIANLVTNIFGDIRGVLAAEVNLKFIWDLVDRLEVGDKGVAYVVDESGDLIAFGDVSRVLREENLMHLEKVSEFVQKDSANGSSEISKGIWGKSVVSSYARLKGPDWAVIVELPVVEAYESLILQSGLSIAALLLSLVLAVVVGIFISKRIARPVVDLRDAANEIGRGRLDMRMKIESKNEIGELASAFNFMAENLKKSRNKIRRYNEDLEQKVKERTEKLEKANKSMKEHTREIERINKLLVGRELKMVELKKEVASLKNKLDEKERQG